ncbi:TIGR03088 family PEP-CTERM/XrtA system glycosyltransferase [Rheinheimera sp. NSM]|uniref:TIGR03088 family PEP-CTERM/XrtA system glycosyltransferase n=1 Tax=Rheinheimera sp. NSM TaxID=3457884 RepID=UPI0040350624
MIDGTPPASALAAAGTTEQLHICHIVWSFRTGGLENGVVNLINQLDQQQFRHSIVCLTDYDAGFFQRIHSGNVAIYPLHKKPGHDIHSFLRCYRLLRQLRPDICHSRNIAALEYQLSAWLAGVRYRIHGEHGWDIKDLAGVNRKYIWLKRLCRPLVNQYVSLSQENLSYLQQQIKVAAPKLNLICNGVDTQKFNLTARDASALPEILRSSNRVIFVSVGRMVAVKNHPLLVNAYIELCRADTQFSAATALVIIGEGEYRAPLWQQLQHAGLAQQCWLPGNRDDVAAILPGCSVFVLPSLAEGISNTVLEAMASGLPVIATAVGGNPDLIRHGDNGWLVPSEDVAALKQQMLQCYQQPQQRQTAAVAARRAAEQQFSIAAMVSRYQALYQKALTPEEG